MQENHSARSKGSSRMAIFTSSFVVPLLSPHRKQIPAVMKESRQEWATGGDCYMHGMGCGRRSDTCRKFDIRDICVDSLTKVRIGYTISCSLHLWPGQHHLNRIRSIFPCISNITHTPVIKEFTCSHTCLYWWLHESCTLGTHMQWELSDALESEQIAGYMFKIRQPKNVILVY